jgi:ribosomal protein L15
LASCRLKFSVKLKIHVKKAKESADKKIESIFEVTTQKNA